MDTYLYVFEVKVMTRNETAISYTENELMTGDRTRSVTATKDSTLNPFCINHYTDHVLRNDGGKLRRRAGVLRGRRL